MSSNLMSTPTSGNTPETSFPNKALITGLLAATTLFVLMVGGLLIWFLFRSGLICTPKHNDKESPAKRAEREKRRETKTSFATEPRNSKSKDSPHPTMGGVFLPSAPCSAEEAGRRHGDLRDSHGEGLQPSRRPNLQPVMEVPAPSNLVLPRVTRTSAPRPAPLPLPPRPPLPPPPMQCSTRLQPVPSLGPDPCTPFRIERHPYAQTRG